MIVICPRCESNFNVPDKALGATGRSVKCSKCAHVWHALPDRIPPPEEDLSAIVEAAEDPSQAAVDAEGDIAEDVSPDDAAAAIDGMEPDATAGEALEQAPVDGAVGMAPDPGAVPPIAEDGLPAPESGDGVDGVSPEAGLQDRDKAARKRRRPPPPPPRRGGAIKAVALVALVLLIAGIAGAGYFLQSEILLRFPATSKLYALVGLNPDIPGLGLKIIEPKPTKQVEGNDEILRVVGQISNKSKKPVAVPLMRAALLDQHGKELHIWTFSADQATIEPGQSAAYMTEFRNPPAAAERLDITFTRSSDATLANKPPSAAPADEPSATK